MMEAAKAIELIRLNVTLEYGLNPAGDLVSLPGSDPDRVARFIIWRHRGGYVTYFRHNLSPAVRARLSRLDPERALYDPETVRRVLEADGPCKDVWAGKGYVFTRIPVPDEFPDATLHEGCYVVMVEGRPVAWAWSQAQNDKAAEVAVEVLPAFRRRGYARQVTAAWAHHVMGDGRVAFFSHVHDNVPSEALARSLEVVLYGVSATYV